MLKTLGEQEVLTIHDEILAMSGGLAGVSPDKSLASALHRIDDHIFYEGVADLHEIAALYAIAIAQGHTFNDGNKRTAMISMIDFLALNGISLTALNDEIENIMVAIAEKKISRDKVIHWIKKHSS